MQSQPSKNAVPISNLLTLGAIKIFPSRKSDDGTVLNGGHASGFFWKVEDELFLITNWHNVCAWDPIQNKSLSDYAFTPNCINLTLELAIDAGDGRIRRDFRQATIDLFDSNGKPKWLEHPIFGNKVDVVGLNVGKLGDAKLGNPPLNSYGEFVDFEPVVGDDVYVLGFPLGLDGGPQLPIWKRASIATEPHYDLEGLPKLLVDTATRRGMSGAPAIVVRKGFTTPKGKGISESILGIAENFLGVYSGRVGDDALGAQLGTIWKASAVDDIVRHGVSGKSPFD